jgi:hypothetical protein
MAKNIVKGTKVQGSIHQSSDVPNTENIVDRAEAQEILQKTESQQSSMQFMGGKARGKIAIICLAVLLLVYLAFRFFASHM